MCEGMSLNTRSQPAKKKLNELLEALRVAFYDPKMRFKLIPTVGFSDTSENRVIVKAWIESMRRNIDMHVEYDPYEEEFKLVCPQREDWNARTGSIEVLVRHICSIVFARSIRGY
jgi:hypothetical protein